ncbi:hypothetical protein [Rhodoferax sp.]|nr:hypothetical protein [Rhodoferax sp.]MDO8772825.1 hypothetical protein [Burkholderiaceae bacterium]MDO9196956.1 hypothetical protein [Rhodoferax sp.]
MSVIRCSSSMLNTTVRASFDFLIARISVDIVPQRGDCDLTD